MARRNLVHMETTTTDTKVAKRMIESILKQELAANAWASHVQAHYLDDGRIRRRKEHFVAFKTTRDKRHRLFEQIRQLHDEETPYIGWLRLHEMPRSYVKWVARRTRNPRTRTRRTKRTVERTA